MAGKNKTGKTIIMDEASIRRLLEIQEDICSDSESAAVRFCISEIHRMRFQNSKRTAS